jgi:hypothetical protein
MSGFSQVPDEHGGPPRIARLVNARVDAPNRISKSPGTTVTPSLLNDGTTLRAPIAYAVTPAGTSIVVDRKLDNGTMGTPVYALESTGWQKSAITGSQSIEIDEAPRTELIFSDADYSYGHPGIVDLGDGDYLAFADAQRIVYNEPAFIGLDSEVHWALLSGTDLQVKLRGSVVYGQPTTGGDGRYPMACGKFVCMWYGPWNIGIYEFVRATGTLTLRFSCAFSASTYVNGMQFDCAYDVAQNRILVAGPSNWYFWVNPSNWTLVHGGTTMTGVTTVATGTLGISIADVNGNGTTYVVWRYNATDWYRSICTVTDAGWTNTVAPLLIHSSANSLAGAVVPQQAKVTAWSDLSLTTPHGALVVIYDRPYASGHTSTQGVLLRIFNTGAVVGSNTAGFEFFGSVPASKPVPVVVSSNGAQLSVIGRCWAYPTSDRTLRSAMFLSESKRAYVSDISATDKLYPRLTGVAFRAAEPYPAATFILTGGTNPVVRTENGVRGKAGWLTMLMASVDATQTQTAVYLVSQCDGSVIDTVVGTLLPDILQTANAGGVTLIASAVPSQFGTRLEMAGSQYTPRKPVITVNAVGTIPAGTYVYVSVRKWIDSTGAVMRSAVSEPVSITSTVAGSFNVRIMDDPWECRQINNTSTAGYSDLLPGTMTEIYRTANAGSVFYLVASEPTPGAQLLGNLLNDTTLDAALISSEILYTQGASGGNSGTLDWWGVPPCRCIWSGFNRVIVGGLENPRRVQLSNLFFPGESISFPSNAAFWIDCPEEITAVACIDQAWLAFSASSVYAFNGSGPDSFGTGTFGDLTRLPSSCGAKSWRSLVETSLGIFFQGPDARIYLVQRGSLQIIEVSQPIRDSIGRAPTAVNGYQAGTADVPDPTYWVVGATYDRAANEVWFIDNLSRSWVYQIDQSVWREETSTAENGKTRIHAGTIRVGTYEGPVFITRDTTTVGHRCSRQSDSNTMTDRNGAARFMGISTNDIDIVHGRIRRAWVKLQTHLGGTTPVFIPSKLHLWFDGLRRDASPDESRAYSMDLSAVTTRIMDQEFCPARQKCNQVRITWADEPPTAREHISNTVLGIDLELEQSPKARGSIRYAGGTNRGT